jgi:hypothetical protein
MDDLFKESVGSEPLDEEDKIKEQARKSHLNHYHLIKDIYLK